MFLRIMFKLKTSLINNENKNRLINLDLLDTYVNQNDFTLLDSGCGKGANLEDIILKYPDARIIGVDNFKLDIDYAKRRFLNKVDFLHCDCLDMKIKSKSVDIVLSNQVIEHILDYEKYLSEIKRILKRNGLLILSTPNFHNPKNTLLKLFSQKPIMRWENNKNLPPDEYRGHIKEFYEDELITLVQKHSFKLIASRPIIPKPSLKGNVLFIVYRLFEYFFYLISKPFVSRGYGNNHNMIFEKN
tara:strand:- start:2602 stop:3333 length:732 start_codon:yes stop_codon:yes gene_type:complete